MSLALLCTGQVVERNNKRYRVAGTVIGINVLQAGESIGTIQ